MFSELPEGLLLLFFKSGQLIGVGVINWVDSSCVEKYLSHPLGDSKYIITFVGHVSGLTLTWVFLLSSIPTFLHRPYSVPLGIPNSAAAFWTGIPPLMASSAVLRSSWVRRGQWRGNWVSPIVSPGSKSWPRHWTAEPAQSPPSWRSCTEWSWVSCTLWRLCWPRSPSSWGLQVPWK